MAIYKAIVHSQYAQIPNKTLQDKTISFEARGVLCLLLSMPTDWAIHKSWILDQSDGCGRDKLTRILKELQDAGYLKKRMTHSEDGKFSDMDWDVYPEPEDTVRLKNRTTVKPYDGKPATTKETILQKKQDTNKHSTRGALECDSLFDQVWQAYPKRQGGNPKPAALAKYKALIRKGYTHEQLMTAVKQYSKLIAQEKTQPQFVKQACTFFGPGGHVDDMLSIYAQDQAKKAINQQKYVTAVVVEKTMSDEARAQFKALREG